MLSGPFDAKDILFFSNLHEVELKRDVKNIMQNATESSGDTGARAAENKDTAAQRAHSSTVGCSMARGSGIHLLNALRSKTEPIIGEKHSLWSVCPWPISGQPLMTVACFHLSPSCRRDWLSLVQGRGCGELQQQ